ncbi:extracellular calcium-sensing receptor-like [Rhinatrema bivittatum]|uniref:extracellular calcium-sensing receptor-like n=1 Tax=Rhinatrema bivittatum TaxID=194408 RepID=UPI0011268B96|nr:extracellular calcium-sensing receptor-like [Rhinatrema bivittatum]
MDLAESPTSRGLPGLAATVQEHRRALESLASSVEELRSLLRDTALANPVGLSASLLPRASLALPAPPRYNGDPCLCRGFLNKCFMQFALQPSLFLKETMKVTFILSCLEDKALAWASPLWECSDPMLSQLSEFITVFKQTFSDPICQAVKSHDLLHLCQESRTLFEYTVEFMTLATELGWQGDCLQAIFLDGLSSALKDELAVHETPTSLEDLISLPGKIDHRLRLQFIFYQHVNVMAFALKEINKNSSLLPNIRLGFWIYDSCNAQSRSLQGTMWQLTGNKDPILNYACRGTSLLAAVIGDNQSRLSISIAQLLGVYKQTQISYASTVAILSDKSRFPSFLRTVPSDDLQSLGIAQLITFFGWTWIGILAENNDYGLIGSQMLKEELVKAGVCVAFYEIIPLFYSQEKTRRIVEVVKKTTAKIIVVFSTANNLYPVMLAIAKSDISGKVWIASDGWADYPIFNEKDFLKTLKGTIAISVPTGNIPSFKEYLYDLHPLRTTEDIFFGQFWEEAFGCRWADPNMDQATLQELSREGKVCTGKEDLRTLNIRFFDMTNLRSVYNAYNAVYMVAHALHAMYTCEPGKGPFFNGTCGDIKHFEPWQGNPPAAYDILNWQLPSSGSFTYVRIGHYDSGAARGQDIKINISAITWSEDYAQAPVSICSESCGPGFRKAILEGQPACCFDCISCSEDEFSNQTDAMDCMKCPDDQWPTKKQDGCQSKLIEFLSYQEPLGMALAVFSVLGALIPAAILVVFIWNCHTPVVKANNRELSYLLLLALILCFGCSLVFIGQPTTLTCLLRQMAFGIEFAICISCLLAKTIMVVIAFKATKPTSNLKLFVGPRLSNSLVLACSLVQVLICVTWLIVAPPFFQMNMKSQMGKIIIECNEGSLVAFCCMLGYMGLLATISFIVAFLARKLPDSFNEAKFITFSMLIFIAVWLSFIPAYLSTTGKYTVAVEIFAILSSSAGLLGCIFFPKCYIILIRSDMNTKEFLMGKATGSLRKTK